MIFCSSHRSVLCLVIIREASCSSKLELIERPTARFYAEWESKLEISIRSLSLKWETHKRRRGKPLDSQWMEDNRRIWPTKTNEQVSHGFTEAKVARMSLHGSASGLLHICYGHLLVYCGTPNNGSKNVSDFLPALKSLFLLLGYFDQSLYKDFCLALLFFVLYGCFLLEVRPFLERKQRGSDLGERGSEGSWKD